MWRETPASGSSRGSGLIRHALRVAILAALVVKLSAVVLDRRERVRHLTLACETDACTASIDGGETLTIDVPRSSSGDKFGLYQYHPYEFEHEQSFENLVFHPDSDPSRETAVSLGSVRDLGHFEADSGWRVHPDGLTHSGERGTRSVALFEPVGSRDFTLELDLIAPVDAGVVFRATDPDNGMLFVTRGLYNDALFFRIRDGEVGPILGLMPLDDLTVGRELVRLGGLTSEIVLVCALFLWVLRWVVPRIPDGGLSGAVWSRMAAGEPAGPRWVLPIFLITFSTLGLVAWFGQQGIPHIQDESAYLFQAKIFASGQLTAPAPAMPEFFEHEHIITRPGAWYAKYPPLFPLLLAVGVLVGAPWIVTPLLGGLTAVVTFLLGRELADGWIGLVAWILTLSSPFFLIMGGTMMSHMACALFVSLFLLLLLRSLRRESSGLAVLAGCCLGAALLTRPYTALLVSIGAGIYGLIRWARSARPSKVAEVYGTVSLVVLVFAAGYLGWNQLHSESAAPAVGLYMTYNDADTLGFGEDKGHGWLKPWGSWGHTPAKALRSVHQYLDSTSDNLLGWPIRLSLAFALAALAFSGRREMLWLLVAVFALLVTGHMFYWATQHLVYGARYWFSAVPALMVLSAIGIRSVVAGASAERRAGSTSGAMLAIGTVLTLLIASNLVFYLPHRLRELPRYAGVSVELKRTVEAAELSDAVVFVPAAGTMFEDGFFLNDPFLQRGVVFARDLGDRNRELLGVYPGRTGYLWTGRELRPMPEDPSAPPGAGPVATFRATGEAP